MNGSNALGMHGSNGRGMHGSNIRGRILGRQGAAGFGAAFSVAAMGTLDSVTVEKGVARLVVAGQVFTILAGEAASLSIGDYVVAGANNGALAVVYHTGMPYAAGLSSVRVKAPVAAVDLRAGTLTVGALTVDYAAQLSVNPTLAPSVGDVVEVTGIQPLARGALIVGSSHGGLSVASAADRR
jgi:hypothetical protein